MRAVSGAVMTLAVVWALGCSSASKTNPDGGTSTTVTLDVLTVTPGVQTPTNADFVAFQDGTGAWTPLTGTAGVYSFEVKDAAGRFNAVVVCPFAVGSRLTQIFEETVAEAPSFQVRCSNPALASPVAVDVTSDNWGSGTASALAIVGGTNLSMSTQNTASSPSMIVPGIYDVLAYTEAAGGVPLRYVLNHGTSIQGTTHLSFDFNGGVAPETENFTIGGGASGEDLSADVQLYTKLGNEYGMGNGTSTPPSFSLPVVPAVQLDPADLYLTTYSGALNGVDRGVISATRNVPSGSLTLPATISGVSTTVAATAPTLLIKAQWSGGIGNSGVLMSSSQASVNWLTHASPNVLAGATTFTPVDPSSAAGWDPAWGLQAGVSTSQVLITGTASHSWLSLLSLFPFPSSGVTDGEVITVNEVITTFTP